MSALTDIFTSIANAIRTKNQSATTYKPSEMSSAILAIPTGGGGSVETLKQASVDVSTYDPNNKPVISPSSGYDSMGAVELTLNNIPSAEQSFTVYPWHCENAGTQNSIDLWLFIDPSNLPETLPSASNIRVFGKLAGLPNLNMDFSNSVSNPAQNNSVISVLPDYAVTAPLYRKSSSNAFIVYDGVHFSDPNYRWLFTPLSLENIYPIVFTIGDH